MTAYGRRVILKTWYAVTKLTIRSETGEPYVDPELLGYSPTRLDAYKLGKRHGLRYVCAPLGSDMGDQAYFREHNQGIDDACYIIEEQDMIHDGSMSNGRLVTRRHVLNLPRSKSRSKKTS